MNQMKRAANIEQPAVESKKKKEKVKHWRSEKQQIAD